MEWIRTKDQLPENDQAVIAVKELKNGTRDICIARCLLQWEHYDVSTGQTTRGPYWVCGGNNNIIYWMPLPEMPKG